MITLMLVGCATMSESECLVADWYQVGVEDGRAGYPDSRLARHVESCESAGTRPDIDAWRSGRTEGLTSFCTGETGWRHGRDGRSYSGVCAPEVERDFLYGYEIGKEVHDLNVRITALENRTVSLERELKADDLDNDERRELLDELSRTQRQMRDLERQRGDAEAEARNRGFRNSR